jgi:hypothetical protein
MDRCEILVNWLEQCRWSLGCIIAESPDKLKDLGKAKAVSKVMRIRGIKDIKPILNHAFANDPEVKSLERKMVVRLLEWRSCLTKYVIGSSRWRSVLANVDIAIGLSNQRIIPEIPTKIVPPGHAPEVRDTLDMDAKYAKAERDAEEWVIAGDSRRLDRTISADPYPVHHEEEIDRKTASCGDREDDYEFPF